MWLRETDLNRRDWGMNPRSSLYSIPRCEDARRSLLSCSPNCDKAGIAVCAFPKSMEPPVGAAPTTRTWKDLVLLLHYGGIMYKAYFIGQNKRSDFFGLLSMP